MTSGADALGHARVYASAGNFTRAVEILGAALAADPEDPALLVAMARARLGLGDPATAATDAHAALTHAPDNADAMRVYAVALDSLGRRHDALSVAYRAVQADSPNHLTHYTYATLLLNAGHAAQALTAAGEAVRLEPSDAENHFLAARILNKLGRIKESTEAYQETLRLDPEHADAAHNIAVNRLNRGQWGQALRGFLGAARMDPALGQHVRRNVGIALIRPLRWTTLVSLLLSFFAIVSHEDTGDHVAPVVTAVAVAVLVALLVWVVRLVPRASRRSVLRAAPMLVVRGGIAVCAVVIGAVSVVGVVPAVSLPAATLLLLGAVLVIIVGWLSGT